MTLKRKALKRVVKEQRTVQTAKEAIGDLYEGMEVFGLNMGQFSIIDIFRAVLQQTGPADVIISTWTVANYEMEKCSWMLNSKQIKSIKWLIDRSFISRQPEYFNNLLKAYGEDCVRITRCHCKFIVIQNEKWNIAIRTSMNLNENKRIENYEISDCKALADYLKNVVADFFNEPINLKGLILTPQTKDEYKFNLDFNF